MDTPAKRDLPPELIDELRSILGADGVVADDTEVEALTRTCLPFRTLPSVVVFPRDTAQVQATVRAAGRAKVPVWPVSTGKNWGYGEKGAVYEAGITMMLERMTRIEQVDEQLGYAVVEPGVTYQQLNDHLKRTGSRLWADCTGSTQHGSVIGNALDKGRGLTPMADHFGSLCGMDVVLADGSLLETGGGPAGNNQVRHTYKWGVGPYQDGLFTQSNLGIVVKSGVWLMPAPERFDFAAFEYKAGPERLAAFIDDLQSLVMSRAVRSHPHLANDFAMMCILAQYPHELLDGRRHLSDEAAARWRREHGVARWTFGCGLYGSREEVRYQKRMIRQVLGRYGMVQFIGAAVRDDMLGRLVRWAAPIVNRMLGKSPEFTAVMLPAINLFRGIPTDDFARQAYFKSFKEKPRDHIDPARDGCGFVWIGPVVPFTSAHVMKALALTKAVFDRHEFDFFVEVIVESPRSVIVLVGVFFERHDAADAARAKAWYEEARLAFIEAGYPPYRATTMSQPHALDANPASKALLAALKRAVDPDNLIAPGRYGTPERRSGP
ncbi:MAG: FAD-binding oxidoreductase [Burkholderiales bacterium]|nr:FAD-binding oxidoreductase [Burkholderiales bacterium]MDE1925697.1 FAD-binding oxidoreductase [Burkholderiales bacterium]MDE2157615.1 FAD-binding oxidoreductase [Burkholderiales bacterium]MDE2504176.1 FAD-binding oxidoreductase [Burkholderiales bacterium]